MEVSVPVSIAQLPQLTPGPGTPEKSPGTTSTPKWPRCTKTYNSKWENDPLLKTWIARHPRDNGKVVCRFCQSVIRAHKNDLLEHTRTLKHQRNFMQNSSPEEYNQFVMELNELRKEANAMSKKRMSNSSTSNPSPSIASTAGVTGNFNNITTVASSTNSAFLSISGNSNSNGGLGDVLGDGDDLWQEGEDFMSAESPSDLVSVILEEQQSPTSTSTCTSTGSGSCHTNSNNLNMNGMSLNMNGINMNISLAALASSNSLNNISNNTNNTSNTSQATLNQQNSSVVKEEHLPFNATDVITSVKEGYFTLPELCAMAKAVTTQMDILIHSTLSSNSSSNNNHTTHTANNTSALPTLSIITSHNHVHANSIPNSNHIKRDSGRCARKRRADHHSLLSKVEQL